MFNSPIRRDLVAPNITARLDQQATRWRLFREMVEETLAEMAAERFDLEQDAQDQFPGVDDVHARLGFDDLDRHVQAILEYLPS